MALCGVRISQRDEFMRIVVCVRYVLIRENMVKYSILHAYKSGLPPARHATWIFFGTIDDFERYTSSHCDSFKHVCIYVYMYVLEDEECELFKTR